MTKQLVIAAVILIVSILLASLLISSRKRPPQRPIENQIPLVETEAVEAKTGALMVSGSGTVRPYAEVNLASQVSGKVVFVNASLVSGGYVREGETLVRIDNADFQNTVQQARADVAQQEVALLQAQEEARLARSEYDRFRAREDRRSADVFASVDENDYAARLVRERGDSLNQIAVAVADTVGPGSLVFREPQLRAAEAALQRSRAQLQNAELMNNRTVIRAPFSGFVRDKNVAVGSFLSPGQSFGQLVASDIFEISVPMTREEAALIPNLWSNQNSRKNAATVFASYGGLRYRWPGYIDRAEAVLNPQTRTINVVVRVPAPITSGQLVSASAGGTSEGREIIPSQSPPLLVGEFVEVEVEGGALERYLVVPRSGLKDDARIWVVRDGEIDIVPVEVLQQADENVFFVADGVSPGDRVVVSDLSVATQGMKVRLETELSNSVGDDAMSTSANSTPADS